MRFPDALVPHDGGVDLGYYMQNNSISQTFTLKNVDLANSSSAAISFNASYIGLGGSVKYRFNNGTWRTAPYPQPDDNAGWVGFVSQIPMSDLHQGNNTLEFQPHGVISWQPNDIVLSNIDLDIVPTTAPPSITPMPSTNITPDSKPE